MRKTIMMAVLEYQSVNDMALDYPVALVIIPAYNVESYIGSEI